jgi:phage tail protein X
LLLAAYVYPNRWSDWVLNRTISSGGTTKQTTSPIQTINQVKKVKEVKTAEEHLDSGAAPKAVTSLMSTPLPGAAGAAVPASAPEMSLVSTASAAPAPSAVIQKQSMLPVAAVERNQITVRPGDTLEKIAVRYFGSTSGVDEIIKANPQLTSINELSVRQIVYLPTGTTPKSSQDSTATTRQVPNVE